MWVCKVSLGLLVLACKSEYPLGPTFCDDWCHVTLQPNCGEDPEDCVEGCELTRASASCFPLQRELLTCYEGQSSSAFSCDEPGGESESRVEPGVCEAERDALFDCQAPGVGQCLEVCRATQKDQIQRASLGDSNLLNFDLLAEDAGMGAGCPALDRPCEDICWSVFSLQFDGLAAAGIATEESGAEELEGNLQCLQNTLLACLAISPAGPPSPDAGISAPTPGTELPRPGESITSAVARCAARK